MANSKFARPTLATIVRRVTSDLVTRLDQQAPRLRHTVEGVLVRVVAGVSHGLHGHLEWIADHMIWDRVRGVYLRRWASIFGIEILPAQHADNGNITVSGTIGTVIPAGTTWSRSDGILYELTEEYVTDSNPDNVAGLVRCTTAGKIGNAGSGTKLKITSPIAGLNAAAVVGGAPFTDGVDQESERALLERFLFRLRRPPSGGGPGDYVRWARSYGPQVTRVFEKGKTPKVGQVTFYVVQDAYDADDKLENTTIFEEPDLDLILAHVETLCPIHMQGKLTCLSPVLVPLSVEIANLDPDTPEMRAAIYDQLASLYISLSDVGAHTFKVGWVQAAIGRAQGIRSWDLTTPAANVTVATGELLRFRPSDLTFT